MSCPKCESDFVCNQCGICNQCCFDCESDESKELLNSSERSSSE